MQRYLRFNPLEVGRFGYPGSKVWIGVESCLQRSCHTTNYTNLLLLDNWTASSPRSIRGVWGVFLVFGLVFALDLLLIYASIIVFGDPDGDPIIEALAIPVATAAGAAIGIRISGISWRQTALVALLSGIGLIAIAWFDPRFLEFDRLVSSLWLEVDSRRVLDVRASAIFLVICGAGVFFLPLFDPLVRKTGIAPVLWKVLVASSGLVLLIGLVDYFFIAQIGGDLGLLTLIIGSISAAVLVGAGLVLTLLNLQPIGAWVGGLGIFLQVMILLVWVLLGRPWFP
jgi:hypothetical protein